MNSQRRKPAVQMNAPAAEISQLISPKGSSDDLHGLQPSHHIALVDDNGSILGSISMLFRSVGIEVVTFHEPTSFLRAPLEDFGCILLDVRLPEMSGMQIFRALKDRGVTTPVIFLTGHGDIPMAVHAMQDGAFDFLEKPFDDQTLIEAVLAALRKDAEQREMQASQTRTAQRLARLTKREREIAELVVNGLTSREIAGKLGLSLRTIEHYRVKIAAKLEVNSVTSLVRIMTQQPVRTAAPTT